MVIQLTIIFDQRMIPRLATGTKCQEGMIRGVAQPGSATALGAVGREFESLHPDHILLVWYDASQGIGFQNQRNRIYILVIL